MEEETLAQDVTYNFINNEYLVSESRTWMMVHDPTTQRFTTRVPESLSVEVQAAVNAAAKAQAEWAALSISKRRALMLDFRFVVKQNAPHIKQCLCLEVGKIPADADAEFERGLDSIETACSVSNEMFGTNYHNQMAEVHTRNEPLGVCVSITPFNFPFMIPLWSIPYALLAGNTVVLKPSEKAPTAAHIIAHCFLEAGFPPGVVNIVHGSSRTVNMLLAQPTVRAISFVGSDIVGERIYEHATATRKRIQAECGGKNHGVVLEDANRLKTLYAIAGSAFGSAGQRCMALSVVVLVGQTKAWLDDLINIAGSLVVGAPFEPDVAIGPVITAEAKARIEILIANAEEEGATVALDGRNCDVPGYPDGNFIGPTILTNVKPYMTCYQEEIFGPVLVCVEAGSLEEAVDLINSNRYGNGCTLFTESPIAANAFQQSVNVGQVGINVPILAPSGPVSRTTNKDSFLGDNRRNPWQFFTMTKTVTTLW